MPRNRGIPAASEEYKMDHPKRGWAYIFNHQTFHPNTQLPNRQSTSKDAVDLKELFEELKFDVKVCLDYSYDKTISELKAVAKLDHSHHDCLVIAFLTHGETNRRLYANDRLYEYSRIFENFVGKKCKTLAGKPKLFLIQASKVEILEQRIETDGPSMSRSRNTYTIPNHADFLTAYSTLDGIEKSKNGTWFVQTFVNMMRINKELDVLSILTKLNQAAHDNSLYDDGKICYFSSSLIRKLSFN